MINNLTLGSTTVCYPLSVSPAFTLERALEGIARCGLQYAEIVAIPGYCPHVTPAEMGDAEIARVHQMLGDFGLAAGPLNVATDLTTPEGVEVLGHTMRVARALGASCVVSHVEHADSPASADRFFALAPRISELAAQYDMVVALEIHGGLISTGAEGVALLKKLGSERFKLTFDMANAVYCGGVLPEDDLLAMGSDAGSAIGHLHLKDKANMTVGDYDFPPFGTGILNFPRVLDLIAQSGYSGMATLEVELDGQPANPDLVDRALAQSYNYLKTVLRGEA